MAGMQRNTVIVRERPTSSQAPFLGLTISFDSLGPALTVTDPAEALCMFPRKKDHVMANTLLTQRTFRTLLSDCD